MKNGFVEIICIIDRSGSMITIKNDAIGAFNQFLEDQKKLPGEASLTLVQFNHEYEMVHENKPIKEVPNFTDSTYIPTGNTALLDAVGKTIDDVGRRLEHTPEHLRPEQVVVAILTDGEENSSKHFKKADIKEKVDKQTNEYKWAFMFLGANQDSFAEAGGLGIAPTLTMNYSHDSKGIKSAVNYMSNTVSAYRGSSAGDNK